MKQMKAFDDHLTFEQIVDDLEMIKKQVNQLIGTVKHIQKQSAKKKKSSNIKSGFVKPVRLSPELSSLIGSAHDELVPRSVVNKKINEYIKEHNLQIPESRQNFVLDSNLANLFGLEEGTSVHYFKMQTYLKHHYPKEVSA